MVASTQQSRELFAPSALPRKLRERWRSIRAPITVLEGIERRTGHPLKMLCGGMQQHLAYISRLAYGENAPSQLALGKHWNSRLHAVQPRDWDIALLPAVLQTPRWLANPGLLMPWWVGGDMPTDPRLPGDHHSKSRKSDLSRIRRHQLTWEISHEPAHVEHFYDRMYAPLVHSSHGESVLPIAREKMLSRFSQQQSELLLIKQGATAIAGSVLLYDDDIPRRWADGVLDAAREHLAKGVISALYLYSSEHLRGQGVERIGLGLSRPFLSDGVLTFKRKWGLRLTDYSEAGCRLHLGTNTPAVQAFLGHNPFIAWDDHGPYLAVFKQVDKALQEKDLTKLRSEMATMGVRTLRVYGPRGDESAGGNGEAVVTGDLPVGA
jgi:hypothetical protein